MSDFKKDYYKILGVKVSATADEIKLAYRKQVKLYHPDLHPGHPAYEDLIKDINEAYEFLGDKEKRYAYDEYLIYKEKLHQETKPKDPTNRNKRSYTRTQTVHTEVRIYIKGEIFIKYFGKHDEQQAENILRENIYNITVTQTDAIVSETHKQKPPKEFKDVFSTHQPIKLNIKQPINSQFIDENNNLVDYQLEILDLTIPNPEIIDVTKHESESFGTITGIFYGYIKEIKSEEKSFTVEECFGETGRKEEKVEHGRKFNRKEYYHADCTTYWGNWTAEPIRSYKPSAGKTSYGSFMGYETTQTGCLSSFGRIISIGLSGLFFLFLFPHLVLLLPFIIIPFLLNLLSVRSWRWIGRGIGSIFAIVFLLALITALLSNKQRKSEQAVVKPTPAIVKPKYTPIVEQDSSVQKVDTLITHHLSWEDYTGKVYEGDFSVKKSSFDAAHLFKENLDIPGDNEANYDRIIYSLKENDKNSLDGLYAMFDSLKLSNRPSAMKFAEMIVSAVQTIPYTIILPKACDARLYDDAYTIKYLAAPEARCDGYERYGINSPVEFLANLNGDCDTRTLLLYTVLTHYNYDVALLSSEHYSHSILGINLPYDGQAFTYQNQRYVFWETTVQYAKPGIIPNEISDPNYWRISLKSK